MKAQIGNYFVRDWTPDDVEAVAKYANNPRIATQLRDGFPHPYELSDAEEFLSRVLKRDSPSVFAIATEEEAIGSIGLLLGKDVHRLSAELGYWLAEPFWNQGIMTMAVTHVVNYGFTVLQLNRIYAGPYATNPASARVLEKSGFVREGVLRASVIKQGRVLDQILYAKVRQGIR